MKAVLWGMAGLLGLVVFGLSDGSAQEQSPCQQAAVWHLHQALRWSISEDQDFHRGAAQAALDLDNMGNDCSGWENDATRPGIDGDSSAAAGDALQAKMGVSQ